MALTQTTQRKVETPEPKTPEVTEVKEFGFQFTELDSNQAPIEKHTIKDLMARVPGIQFSTVPMITKNGKLMMLSQLGTQKESIFLSNALCEEIVNTTQVKFDVVKNEAGQDRITIASIKGLVGDALTSKKKEINKALRNYKFSASRIEFFVLRDQDGTPFTLAGLKNDAVDVFGEWAE